MIGRAAKTTGRAGAGSDAPGIDLSNATAMCDDLRDIGLAFTSTPIAVMIKRTLLLAVVLLGFAVVEATQQPDFNGTWRLNEEASRVTTNEGLSGLGNAAPEMLYITQRRSGEVIISTRLRGSVSRDYVMGGSTWVPAPPPSTAKFLISSRTRGMSMISEASGEVEGEMVQVREVLTMDPRGRRITLEVTTTRSWGPETNLLVYDRVGGTGGG